MEKLIELVYYYNSHLEKGIIGIGLTTSVKEDGREVHFDKEKEIRKYESYIISKKYGFIERLVKNDKIDFEKIKEKTGLNIEFELYNTMEYFFEKDALSIMLLSIQDNPIEYLCSILK